MFPNSQDAPAPLAEHAAYPSVTGLIGQKLFFPECLVAFGFVEVLRASVPETSVNKDRQAGCEKGKIRPAENWLPASPPRYSVQSEQFHQSKFRVLIPVAADAGHHL